MVWSRETWRDGAAICEDKFYTAWRHKEVGEYEVRHLDSASACPVVFAERYSWKYLPVNWEIG